MTSTTPSFAIPYPDPTDPVANGDDTIKALAERLDKLLPFRYDQVVTIPSGTAVGVATLNFGRTYSAAPSVVATPCNVGSSLNNFIVNIDQISTTSCRVVVRHFTNTNVGANTNVNVSVLVAGTLP